MKITTSTHNTILYNNGTLITELRYEVEGQGLFEDIEESMESFTLLLQTCFIKQYSSQTFEREVEITNISSVDSLVEIEIDNRTYFMEEVNKTIETWEIFQITNGTILSFNLNVTDLDIGEDYTLTFCYPSEKGDYQQSTFTQYIISLLVERITVVVS
jgi:hypothetical protein